jgi:hypothetical protein
MGLIMEPVAQIAQVLSDGGPWAACALALAAWAWERRETKLLQKSILELATAQTEALVKQETALVSLREVLSAVLSRRRG